MSLFKCKMCGGSLEVDAGATVMECEYCGTQQTLPKLDDDRRANMYDRANHFRRNNEFDKAMGIYENILNEDGTDAEAYWSLVLCRYGIEYVEDPASHKRIPTVNRAQFTSIYDDDNYKSALQYADSYQKRIYEEEARAINEIQKGILAISQKEEPFDVFICYKESDNTGRRTPDSVLAQELYYGLNDEGFKVFFARITLEDKLGSAYEPYIFAALNSAKVMVTLGTKPEYFNAVWVKNEWSRYLALIKQGQKKMLIPAYKDMDPYDLPEEFSHLQAQDMSKLGFMQDLIRGIKKIVKKDEPKPASTVVEKTVVKETAAAGAGAANVDALLKRVFMFLEDRDWKSANEYCEKVLDIDPENAQAYLGKLMADLRVKKRDEMKDYSTPFDNRSDYQKVLRFGDEAMKKELQEITQFIKERNEQERLLGLYNSAVSAMNAAKTEEAYKKAAEQFAGISQYKDSAELRKKCLEKAEIARKDAILNEAKAKEKNATIPELKGAITLYKKIPGWKDADESIARCQKGIEELTAKAEADRIEAERLAEYQAELARNRAKRNKKILMITSTIIGVIIVFTIVLITVIIPAKKKNEFIATYGQEIFDKVGLVEKGAYISLGAYEQDNNTSNGKEEIKWLVLEVKDGRALVISKYALDCKEFNKIETPVTWGSSSLKKWLNNDFANDAFSTEEKTVISTQDQVFLLSRSEANKYFRSDRARQCKATAYAVANGARVDSSNGNISWWLREGGDSQTKTSFVCTDGEVDKSGITVDNYGYTVRPAMWIDLNT